MEIVRRYVRFTGKVQGVNFRKTSINFKSIVAVMHDKIFALIPEPNPSDRTAISRASSGYLFEMLSKDEGEVLQALRMEYLGIPFLALCFYVFVVNI